MKKILCVLLISVKSFYCFSQALRIPLATDQTTSLIFNQAIMHVDLGSKDLLAQQVPVAPHIIFIKAAVADFKPTNLSVVTKDGNIHVFLIHFHPDPPQWVHRISDAMSENQMPLLPPPLRKKNEKIWVKDVNGKVRLHLNGIYVKDSALFFNMEMKNQSPLDFEIGQVRCLIKDRKGVNRTSYQEREIIPIQPMEKWGPVKGGAVLQPIIILPKMSLRRSQVLLIQIKEKEGGRELELTVDHNRLLKALPLNR